ncbi:MarR family winged helix-turn-helix transcriptional regulator [Geodermatophilus sp. SYSU D00079]
MGGLQPHREKLPVTIDREAYTPAYLSLVANALSWGSTFQYMRRFGVGVNDWRIVSALGNHPGATAGAVCTVLGLNKSVVSRSVAGLAGRGLVTIERVDGQRRLYLTAEGVALHDQLLPLALERERRMLRGFSEEEVGLLRDFLRRMHDNLSEAAGPGEGEDPASDASPGPAPHP